MKFYLTKRIDGAYLPSSDIDYDESKRIKPGQSVEIKLANERTMWRHRRFFLALKLAFENMPEQFDTVYPTQDSLRKGILIMSGHVDIVREVNGTEHINAGSMSFINLGEAEFTRIYSACIDTILKYFVTDRDLQEQLIELT